MSSYATSRPSRRDLTNVQLVTREWQPTRRMTDNELRYRELDARRVMRAQAREEERLAALRLGLVVLAVAIFLAALMAGFSGVYLQAMAYAFSAC